MANRWGKSENSDRFYFLGLQNQTVTKAMKLKDAFFLLRRNTMTNLDRVLKSRYVILLTKVQLVKTMLFPVVKYVCESCRIKKAEHQRVDAFKLGCWTSLLSKNQTSKEIKPVNPKGNQSWIFIGRTDAEAPILWPPDANHWLTGKTLMLGKI